MNVSYVDLRYPRVDGNVNAIEIDLEDVRAADSILVHYDFERDGWVISQASKFSFDPDDTVCDPDWQEVAFVEAPSSVMPQLYRQCELQRGDAHQTAWIPNQFAVVGRLLKLKHESRSWIVKAVFAIEPREYLDAQHAADKRWKSVIHE